MTLLRWYVDGMQEVPDFVRKSRSRIMNHLGHGSIQDLSIKDHPRHLPLFVLVVLLLVELYSVPDTKFVLLHLCIDYLSVQIRECVLLLDGFLLIQGLDSFHN